MKRLKEIYNYREMIYMLVKRNLRGRYKASFLGFAWTFINPLLQLLIYTVVFSFIFRSNIDKYYLFLFVALIPWIAMSTSVIDSSVSVVSNSAMVTKIYFPREVLPITSVTTCFVNMLLCMIVVIAVAAFSVGINVTALLFLVPTVIVEYVLALGIAFIVSSLTVYFRDLEHILGIFILAWQFMSPVMYPISQIPEKYRSLFSLNPMASIINSYRDILYYKQIPDLKSIFGSFITGIVLCLVGFLLFNKLQKHFAEEL